MHVIRKSTAYHIVIKRDDPVWTDNNRVNVSKAKQPLQLACMQYDAETVFEAHYHLNTPKHIEQTQEVWVVLAGEVEAAYYDCDGNIIEVLRLFAGDISITYQGGHALKMISDARIVEVKNGPYLGKEADKKYFEPEPDKRVL